MPNQQYRVPMSTSSVVLVKNTTLTAAQVNALTTTPVILIPGVSGKSISLLQFNITYNFGSTAFTVLDFTSVFSLNQGPDNGFTSQIMKSFCDQPSSQIALNESLAIISFPLSDIQGSPITVNNTGTASSGGSGSTVTFNLLYTLL